MDRRSFVRSVVGLPIVFGLWKFQDEEPKKQTKKKVEDTFALAKKRMKATGQNGLVFVLPKGKSARKSLACALYEINSGSGYHLGIKGKGMRFYGTDWDILGRKAQILRSTCVLICLEESEAKKHLGSTDPRVLIDQNGKILRKLKKIPADLANGMLDRLLELAHGKDLVELKKKSDEAQASFDEEKRKRLKGLIHDLSKVELRRDAPYQAIYGPKRRELLQVFKDSPIVATWCAWVLLEVRTRERSELATLYAQHIRTTPHLPAGSILPVFQDGACLSFSEVKPGEKPSERLWNVSCGMGSISLETRKFLRFVGDK